MSDEHEAPVQFRTRPAPFEPGAPTIWDDPHIGGQLLAAHLDPTTDAASRRPETIDATVAWIIGHLGLPPGATLLDLGCGPGLYANRFAAAGLGVTGVDRAALCLAHAREGARELPVMYVQGDFSRLDYGARFDVVTQIYGELSASSPTVRDRTLVGVRRALRDGGRLVFDVSTPLHHRRRLPHDRVVHSDGGFWSPRPHRVHERRLAYDDDVFLDEYVVVEKDGTETVHRIWYQAHTVDRVTSALESCGFAVESIWSDLWGTPHTDDSEWIGVVARPV